MYKLIAIRILTITLLITSSAGCALFRFGGNPPEAMPTSAPIVDADREAALRDLVASSLRAAERADSPSTSTLEFRRPYYFREYVAYPDGITGYELNTVASDSQTTPYTAQVKLKKNRHVTRFEKKKERVSSDGNFYASSGMETRTYELRHGRWREVGTLFVAEESDPALKSFTPQFDEVVLGGSEPEKKGILGRMLFWRD
jgi:hypothetical protein